MTGRLAEQTDDSLRVSVAVQAEHKATDDTVGTISENARTLRFRDCRWERE